MILKMSHKQQFVAILCLISAAGLAIAGLCLAPRLAVGRIHTDGITSYYVRSNADAAHREKLPAIIIVGHLLSSPFKDLSTFKDQFDEPVLLIWSGLLSDLKEDCPIDDEAIWARKREQFPKLLNDYRRKLDIDENRVYLTGYSFAGVYAWMLAYDRPELYAAVVPMSATSYPRQLQENLETGKEIVTVWVRGEKDDTPPRDLAAEIRTGKIIESYNERSRFVLKPGEGHRDMHKYWLENLRCVLEFRRNDGRQEDHE